MRILGIDPGSHRTGWGVVEGVTGRLVCLGAGVVQARGESTAERLCSIHDGLSELLRRFAPEAVSVETVFHAKNAQSALVLGQARGVALLCAAQAGAAVFEYTAGQIKQAATGRGRAEKEQVQTMVRLVLGIDEALALDASDALAAALCHAQSTVTPQAAFLREVAASRRKKVRAPARGAR